MGMHIITILPFILLLAHPIFIMSLKYTIDTSLTITDTLTSLILSDCLNLVTVILPIINYSKTIIISIPIV